MLCQPQGTAMIKLRPPCPWCPQNCLRSNHGTWGRAGDVPHTNIKTLHARDASFCQTAYSITWKHINSETSASFFFLQYFISFSTVVHYDCNIFVWNWSNAVDIWSALWILMPWCWSTRASVATGLSTHLCIYRCLWVKGEKNNHQSHDFTLVPVNHSE